MPDQSSTPIEVAVDLVSDGGNGGDGGAYFWRFRSSSVDFSTAERSLPSFLDRFAPDLDQSAGVLFAIPHRGLLMARDVTSGDHLYNGIGMMAPYAVRAHERGEHPVFPEVRVLVDGGVSRVSSVTEPGRGDGGSFVRIHEDGPLAALLRETARDHGGSGRSRGER